MERLVAILKAFVRYADLVLESLIPFVDLIPGTTTAQARKVKAGLSKTRETLAVTREALKDGKLTVAEAIVIFDKAQEALDISRPR